MLVMNENRTVTRGGALLHISRLLFDVSRLLFDVANMHVAVGLYCLAFWTSIVRMST